MHIRPLNLGDDDEVHEFYQAFRDAELAENADRPTWPEEALVPHLRSPAGDEEPHAFVAYDDASEAKVVGVAFMFYPLLDNTTKTYVGVFVPPAERGRGVGSTLVEHVVDRARTDKRFTVLAASMYGFDRRESHPYRRFAERHGFAVASTEVCRRLALPVPDAQIQSWIDEASPHHTAYRIETFTEDIPDELLESVCYVVNQLALDAPTGDIDMEAEQITPEIRRRHDARAKESGLQKYETVAIDSAGSAVAMTGLGIHLSEPDKVHQWATIVQKEHRGHRLGLAIKAHNLRALQRGHPGPCAVFTTNEETNGPMVAINEQMGFEPVELEVAFQRKLLA